MANSSNGRRPQGKPNSAARERARALLAQQQRQARQRLLLRVVAPVLAVVVVVAILVIVKVNQHPAQAATGSGSTSDTAAAASSAAAKAASVAQTVASIPAATFDTVGAGTIAAAPSAVTGTTLTAAGKPRVLYIGAEYCPYCAAERWAIVSAMSRFGSFSGLGLTTSSAKDVYPSTATLSFHGSTYTSDVLSFTGIETTTNVPQGDGYTPLDTPTAADQAIAAQYNSAGSIPFVDIGNKYVISGASYDPAVLQGLTQTQIAADLKDPTSPVSQAVVGTANVVSAALCTLTDNKPAAVCSSAGVVAGAAKLPH